MLNLYQRHYTVVYLIYNSLHQIELSLQRRVQQQSERVELDSQPVSCSLRRRLLQVGTFNLGARRENRKSESLLYARSGTL